MAALIHQTTTLIYIKNSNKKLFFNQKYIAKISNPIRKPQFVAIIKLTYTEIK